MRIRSLEISGFKSFAQRVVLAFEPGVSAIVGPNGCGKSNVVDAIRWVMGEHNPRQLRGREMDDLIFAGSEARPAVGMAEVVLKLDASDGRAPADYAAFPEIQISRRLYRSGESEYLINRVPVRRRDVTDFFLDTGIGTRGYTIVEQGQIATIVSTRPEERRAIFEEAAGIGKYRQRRRETESKLRSTTQNLVRIQDVLGELRRQIGSLDRQARKATQYRKLSAEAREVELCVSRAELDGHAERVAAAERELEEARVEVAALEARVGRSHARLETLRRTHLDRERELEAANEALFELRGEIRDLESRIEYEEREARALEELAEVRASEAEALAERAREREQQLQTAIRELAFADERLEQQRRELERADAELRERTRALSDLSGRREAARAEGAELGAEVAALEGRAALLDERREELEVRLRQQDELLEQGSVELEALRHDEGALEVRLRETLSERDDLGRRLAELLGEQQRSLATLERERAETASAQQELERASARLDSLRESEREAAARGAQALERLPEALRRTVRGRLSEAVAVDDGLERALETALGDRLDALLVHDAAAALALVRWMRGEGDARTTVLVAESAGSLSGEGLVPLGRPLLDAVTAKPPFESLVRRLLDQVYLVEDIAEAVERYGLEAPPAVFVTREGEILDRSGALTGGAHAAPGAIHRAGEIRRLEGRVRELVERATALEAAREASERRLSELAIEVENARNRRHTAELALLHVEKDLERLRERGKQAIEQAEEQRGGRAVLARDLELGGEERERIGRAIDEKGGRRSQLEREREALERRLAELSRERERAEESLVQQRIDLAQLTERRDRIAARHSDVEASLREDRERLERLRAEVTSARERAASLSESVRVAESALSAQIAREETQRVRQETLRETYQAQARELEEADGESGAASRARDTARERLQAREIQTHDLRLHRDTLLERIRERFDVDLAQWVIPEARRAEPVEAQREQLQVLQQRLRALGDVHVGAIEEYEEVSERFRYLSEQKEDLEVSVERLRNAIARINRTSRARFRETFEAVNAEFKTLFPVLFQGGRAQLSLTPAEDVLDAGIEIQAQPPGKRLQNVNLLSGGEKSLAAIALLFAVFRVKPSPFFLLDEVDAALDEANVGRFNDLVLEMASSSQFLLITHNKSTIEIARSLYGVTMETPGESKLVTVELS
ncbi:MAG: chromosome segregation protein SMC [Myxococcota bacterium]